MSVYQKCLDLAEHFLSEVPWATKEDRDELAEAIQEACEDARYVVEQREKHRRPP